MTSHDPIMSEEIEVTVKLSYTMPAQLPAEAQQEWIRDHLRSLNDAEITQIHDIENELIRDWCEDNLVLNRAEIVGFRAEAEIYSGVKP